MRAAANASRRRFLARWRIALATVAVAIPLGGARGSSGKAAPIETVADLIGLRLRVARPNQPLTMDYRADRVTVLLDESDRIREIRRG